MNSSDVSTSNANDARFGFGRSLSVRLKKFIRHLRVEVTIAEDPARPTWRGIFVS